jgi:4-carboxymuconolactone decarboxylase
MTTRLIQLLLAATAILSSSILSAQTKLPPDVDPKSYSRLPLLTRDKMTPEQVQALDKIAKDRPNAPVGPGNTYIYSPGVAVPTDALNQYLRNTVVGTKFFEICAMIGAWEVQQAYEWSAHEAGARRAGVDPATIEAIKFNRGTGGLPEKDALVIQFARELFRGNHRVSPATYTKVVEQFGQQGMLELTATMGDYFMVGLMLNAAGQELPPERPNTLPAR